MSKTPHVNTVAAADKQAGFDYQFYIFLLKCLQIKQGQVIGYEEKDDVHIEHHTITTYIQVKHTITTNISGNRPNLTQKDHDLWKTINNWVLMVNDSNSGRKEQKDQLVFLDKSEFILFTNKSFSSTNNFISLVNDFKKSKINIDKFRLGLTSFIIEFDHDKISEVDRFILNLNKQTDSWITLFVSKLSFSLDNDKIIDVLIDEIKERFMVQSDTQARDIFNCMFANLKSEVYSYVSKGQRSISFTYLQIKSLASSCLYMINKPILRVYDTLDLPENLREQIFIKQLIDIGDMQDDDDESVINYTKFKVLMARNMKDWEQNHELLATSKKAFIDDCILKWKNLHIKHHRNPFKATLTEEALKLAGLKCVDDIRQIILTVNDVQLDSALSNGQFYSLSDELQIGWAHDWDTKYFNNDKQ